MPLGHAKILTDAQFEKLLKNVVSKSTRPLIDEVMFLLSFKAGLRVQEIAGLRWDKHILDAEGQIRTAIKRKIIEPKKGSRRGTEPKIIEEAQPVIYIGGDIAKGSIERTEWLNLTLFKALEKLRKERDSEWVIPSGKPHASSDLKARAHALKMRINRIYDEMGYKGCSSHSGRRTFVTKKSQVANLRRCSIIDVMHVAGHKSVLTTQKYVELSDQRWELMQD